MSALYRTLVIQAPLLSIINYPASGVKDEAYSFALTATGNTTGVVWSIAAGALPTSWTINSSTGVISGTSAASVGQYTFTVRAENVYGGFDESEFTVTLGDISCTLLASTTPGYDQTDGFPKQLIVSMPPTIGTVVLQYAPGGIPDAFIVVFDDVKKVDTGFVGNNSAGNQTSLNTVLSDPANAAEVTANGWLTTGQPIVAGDIIASSNAGTSTINWGWRTWDKDTATDFALLKMYPGAASTAWRVTMSCPGEAVLWTPHHMPRQPDFYLDNTSTITDVSGKASQWNRCPHYPFGGFSNTSNWHVYQTDDAKRPSIQATGLNGLRTIRADGSNDFMIATAAAEGANSSKDIFKNKSAGYCFFVFKRNNATGTGFTQNLFYNTKQDDTVRLSVTVGTAGANKIRLGVRALDGDTFRTLSSASDINDTEWHMALCVMNWTTREARIFIDGALDSSNTLLTTAGNTSNTSSFSFPSLFAQFDGTANADAEIAEIFAHGVLPSADDINRMFGYAAHKWGLTANLPAEHLYKTNPPLLNNMNVVP